MPFCFLHLVILMCIIKDKGIKKSHHIEQHMFLTDRIYQILWLNELKRLWQKPVTEWLQIIQIIVYDLRQAVKPFID